MSSVVISGDTSGSITVAAPAVAGTYTNTLPQITGTLSTLDRGTAVTASGTSVDFTSIPANVKRITVMFSGVSTTGASLKLIQLGDSGGIETTGYVSGGTYTNTATSGTTATAGLLFLGNATSSGDVITGIATLTLLTGTTWVMAAVSHSTVTTYSGSGSKTLTDTLTSIRITTVNGTDTYDAGTINILYE